MSIRYVIASLESLFQKAPLDKYIFIGSLGFEERSIGSIRPLIKFGKLQEALFLVAHGADTNTKGHVERLEKQRKNRKELKRLLKGKTLSLFDFQLNETLTSFGEVEHMLNRHDDVGALLIDFSTMPKGLMFPLIRLVIQKYKHKIIFLYSTPHNYAEDHLFYDVAEPSFLPGFRGKENRNLPWAWIPVLGYEGDSGEKILKWGNFERVLPIIAFPGYQPVVYVNRVLYENRKMLQSNLIDRVYYSTANNPFRTMYLLEKFLSSLKDYNVILTPMGPKPHGLGVCLTAIKHNLGVVHAQPWSYNPNYSNGYRETFCYLID